MRPLCELRPDLGVPNGSGWALVLDADRTLAEIDTGRAVGKRFELNERVREMFAAQGYEPAAFEEHARVWSGVPGGDYERAIQDVAAEIRLHDLWLEVLPKSRGPALVVTAGIPQVWRTVLGRLALNQPVFGGLHASFDSYFVTPACKAWVVQSLQARGYSVLAAGDSEIDIPMLQAADLPLWVPDAKGSPRLRARLGEIPGIRQVGVDDRRFAGLEAVHARDILMLLQGGEP